MDIRNKGSKSVSHFSTTPRTDERILRTAAANEWSCHPSSIGCAIALESVPVGFIVLPRASWLRRKGIPSLHYMHANVISSNLFLNPLHNLHRFPQNMCWNTRRYLGQTCWFAPFELNRKFKCSGLQFSRINVDGQSLWPHTWLLV